MANPLLAARARAKLRVVILPVRWLTKPLTSFFQLTSILELTPILQLTSIRLLALVRLPTLGLEPMERCCLASKGPDIQPALSRDQFKVLVRGLEIYGVGQQGDLVWRGLCKLLEVLDKPVLFELKNRL